jgi:hypothetical protein
MKLKAHIVQLFSDTFTDDKGKEQPYFQMIAIDMDAPKKETVQVKVNKDHADEVNKLVGKTCTVDVAYKVGKLHYIPALGAPA